jgi:hypothetical protein
MPESGESSEVADLFEPEGGLSALSFLSRREAEDFLARA